VALSEIDTPTGPGAVLTHDFSIGRRGYDPEEVHAHLRRVADEMGRLQAEVDRRRAREELLERKIASAQEAAYARVFRHLMDVMRAAEEAGGRVRGAAEDEADAILAEAREEAARIAAVARADAERLLTEVRARADAQAEADRLLTEVRARADAQAEADRMVWATRPAPPAPAPPSEASPAPAPAASSEASPAPAAPLRLVPPPELVVSVQEPAVVRDLEELERSLRWLSEDEWEASDAAPSPSSPDAEARSPAGPGRSPDLSLRLQAEVLQVFADGTDAG
jgi:DivIVA domain-containing protein